MSLIIILLAVFNNFAIWHPYLLSQAPHIIARPPQAENVATPLQLGITGSVVSSPRGVRGGSGIKRPIAIVHFGTQDVILGDLIIQSQC